MINNELENTSSQSSTSFCDLFLEKINVSPEERTPFEKAPKVLKMLNNAKSSTISFFDNINSRTTFKIAVKTVVEKNSKNFFFTIY